MMIPDQSYIERRWSFVGAHDGARLVVEATPDERVLWVVLDEADPELDLLRVLEDQGE